MNNKFSYFSTGDKVSKVTEDGLRINVYPSSGIVTTQSPGQSHSEYDQALVSLRLAE